MGSGLSFFFPETDANYDGTQIPDPDNGYVLRFAQSTLPTHKQPIVKHMAPSMKSPSAQQQRGESINTRIGAKPSVLSGPSHNSRSQQSTPTKMAWILKECRTPLALQDLDMGRVIGMGLMGTVQMARLKNARLGPSYVAIKKIGKAYIERHKDERHINFEREILMSLGGSNFCIKLFSSFQDTTSVYFAMELVPGGELFQRIQNVGKMHPNEARFYTIETFSALHHIHSRGYCYRDLKPENVMIDAEGHCKLVDFGFSTRPDGNGLMKTVVGTPVYLSPEQLNGKFTGGYASCCDFWSLGIFLFELLTGRTPYSRNLHDTQHEVYLRILRSRGVPFPHGFDRKSKQFISALCQKDFQRRLWRPEAIRRNKYFLFKEPEHAAAAAPSSSSLLPPSPGGGKRGSTVSISINSVGSNSNINRSAAYEKHGSITSSTRALIAKNRSSGSFGDESEEPDHSANALFEVAGGGTSAEKETRKRRGSVDSRASGRSGTSSTRSSFDTSKPMVFDGTVLGGVGDDGTEDDCDHQSHVAAGPEQLEAERKHRDSEILDHIWIKVNDRLLIPPYVPKLSNEKAGDDRYFRNYSQHTSDSNASSSSISSPFDGF